MNEDINSLNAGYAFYKEYLRQTEDGKWDDNKEKRERTTRAKRLDENLVKRMNSKSSLNEWFASGREKTLDILKYIGGNDYSYRNYKVCYPGLLIGSGYPHMPDDELEGGIQNGFLFDFTTGAPYIPGSSIKGVIEDVFNRAVEGRENEREGYVEYINDILDKKLTKEEIEVVWKKSFRGIKDVEGENTEYEPVKNKDIFFDAFLVGTVEESGSVMGIDSITPHKYVKDGDTMERDFDLSHMPLFEPNPITILRVMPGAVFSINMKVNSVKYNDKKTLTADEKTKLYYRILEDFGVGSKTNLGYGTLKGTESAFTPEVGKLVDAIEDDNKAEVNQSVRKVETEQQVYSKTEVYDATVIYHDKTGKFAYVELKKNGEKASFYDENNLEKGTIVKLKYKGKKINKKGIERDKWELVQRL